MGLDVQKEFKPKVDPRKFINVASTSNMARAQLTPEINEILEALIADDPMEVVEDDSEMRDIFQPPVQLPNNKLTPPSPPKVRFNPVPTTIPADSQMHTDIEEMSDNIDIQDYNKLFKDISCRQERGGPSTSFESRTFQQAQKQDAGLVVQEKKKPSKKKAAALEPCVFRGVENNVVYDSDNVNDDRCKHLCKHKDKYVYYYWVVLTTGSATYSPFMIRCRHKCCKRALDTVKVETNDTPPIIGTKRPSPEDENEKQQPASKRKTHASAPTTEPSAATTTAESNPSQKDIFDYFVQLSQKGD